MKVAPEIRLVEYQARLFERYCEALAGSGLDKLEVSLAACMELTSAVKPPYSEDLVKSGGAERLAAMFTSLLAMSASLLARIDQIGLIDRQADPSGMN